MSQNTAVSRRAREAPSLRMITAVEMSWLTPMTRGELTWSWNHVLCEDDGWFFFYILHILMLVYEGNLWLNV